MRPATKAMLRRGGYYYPDAPVVRHEYIRQNRWKRDLQMFAFGVMAGAAGAVWWFLPALGQLLHR